MWLFGRGSNLLVSDQGLPGVTLVTTNLKELAWSIGLPSEIGNDLDGGSVRLRVGAGYSLAKLAQEAGERGLSGLEFARGIPGTVGGAIIMNAGAHGQEIGERVVWVKALVDGELRELTASECNFGYRESSLKDKAWVLEAELELFPGEREEILLRMQENLRKRAATQPLEWPNAGSVFRNPPGDFAARLIEEAGWKGKSCGAAKVSEKHSNFIINTGGARAADVLFLIRAIRADVYERFGIELQPEIQYLGTELEARL